MRYFLLLFLLVALVFSCKNKTGSSKEPPLPAKVDSLFQVIYVDTLSRDARYGAIHQLEDYFKTRENDSTTRRNYFKIANRYHYLNDYKGYYNTARIAYNLGVQSKDTLTLARGYYYLGDYHLQYKSLDSAFYYYMKSKTLYEITDDIERLATVLRGISIIYKDIKDYNNSEKYAVESLELLKTEYDPYYIYTSYNDLGILMTETKNYSSALSYFISAIEIVEHIEDMAAFKSQLKAQTIINMGVLYQKQERYEEALYYFNKALEIIELEYQNLLNYSYLLQNLAYTQHKLGKQNVLPIFKRALHLQDSLEYGYAKSATQAQIAIYYLERNQQDSSYYFANAAYHQAKQAKVLDNELQALHLLAKSDPQNSSQWYETYISLQDSITGYERKQQEKFALIAFDTENIKIQKLLAESRAGRLVYQLWSIAGISILLISLGFLVFKYRSKRLTNRELLLKQEELKNKEKIYAAMLKEQFKIEQGKHIEKKRISRELHDGVLGKLSGIRLNLFVLNKKNDPETVTHCLPYIKSIQEVEKEIRAISHDLSGDLFSDHVDFKKMVVNLYEKIARHTSLKFHIYIDELIDWKIILPTFKIEIYRIIQEGLHNIEKHAKARNVIIKMHQNKRDLVIELIDDGIGIDKKTMSKGIGMKNMKERAANLKASLHIDTEKNNGTTLSLFLPKEMVFGQQ